MQHWFLSVTRLDRSRRAPVALWLVCMALAGNVVSQTNVLPSPAGASPAGSPFGSSAPRFLEVDEAFSFYTSLDARDQISVHWAIAPHYYLYQDKFSFHIIAPQNLASELTAAFPQGINHNDEFFGDVVVYYGDVRATIALASAIDQPFVLEIHYQGCADAGLCYPPQRRQVEIFP